MLCNLTICSAIGAHGPGCASTWRSCRSRPSGTKLYLGWRICLAPGGGGEDCNECLLFLPTLDDVLIRGSATECFAAFYEIVDVEKIGQMFASLVVHVIMVAIDCRFFQRAVHALDLTVGPQMLGFGQAMGNLVLPEQAGKAMGPVPAVSLAISKLNPVIGGHCMDGIQRISQV